MPTYILRNTETEELYEEFCTWDELEKFLKDNPKDLYKPSVALIRQSLLRATGQYDIAGY